MNRVLKFMLRRLLASEMRKRGFNRLSIFAAGAVLVVVLGMFFGGAPRFMGRIGEFPTTSPASSAAPAEPAAARAEAVNPPPTGVGGAGQPIVAPGKFDYYLLALSWSPTHCRRKPDSDQCGQGRRFVVHGLWPQFEKGWPSDCETTYKRPTTTLLKRYEDLSGSRGLLRHQWRKHGACTGLSPGAYFATMAAAAQKVTLPPALANLTAETRLSPSEVEQAFIRANPALKPDGVTVKCAQRRLREVRICMTKDLQPRVCGPDAIRDCRARAITAPPPQ